MKTIIIAADKIIDHQGSFKKTDLILTQIQKLGMRMEILEIMPLIRPWNDKLGPLEFKSGASAMAAIEKAKSLLSKNQSDVIIIQGQDFLKTGIDRKERSELMKLYEGGFSPLDGYEKLTSLFLKKNKITDDEYFTIRDLIFQNLLRTWQKKSKKNKLPEKRWYESLTHYFRGVDCANPNIDYQGRIILTTPQGAKKLGIPKEKHVEILVNSSVKLKVDGMESLPHVAPYRHLKKAIKATEKAAKIDFLKEIKKKNLLLDAYTCYPVVPMALLMSMGLIKKPSDFENVLKDLSLTVTGGLNLSRAPWNLTSLNALIEMRQTLLTSKKAKYGLVHGNGSLGNHQGITVLKK